MELKGVGGTPPNGSANGAPIEATPVRTQFFSMPALSRLADPVAEVSALRALLKQYPSLLISVGDTAEYAHFRHPGFPHYELFKKSPTRSACVVGGHAMTGEAKGKTSPPQGRRYPPAPILCTSTPTPMSVCG